MKVVENRQVPIIFGEDFVVHVVVIRLVAQAVGKPGKLVPAVVRLCPDDGGGDPAVDEEQVHAPEEDEAQERPDVGEHQLDWVTVDRHQRERC